uniref:Enah/Vasp-like b n=1 Tax=Iconisemion striatum TaxID=60296 RepID=A0A1A7WNK9_9TELE
MQLEIQVALNFIISYLYNKLPRRRVNIFGEELERQLKQKYEGHWYPDKPYKGSGFRCIHVGEKVDPVVEKAAKESGLEIEDVRNNLPQDLSVWIDPYEVSYQIGEKGPVKVLYVDDSNESGAANGGLDLDKEIKNSFNPDAQVFMPISEPVNGASPGSSSPSPPFGHSAAVSPTFMPRSTQPLTFTTATFAATKFGSTKMKSSGRSSGGSSSSNNNSNSSSSNSSRCRHTWSESDGGSSQGDEAPAPTGLAAMIAGAKLRRVQRPEESSSGAKNDANRTSGGSGGLMEEMNALLARRRKAASEKPEDSQNDDPNSPSPSTRSGQNSTDGVKKPWDRANSADRADGAVQFPGQDPGAAFACRLDELILDYTSFAHLTDITIKIVSLDVNIHFVLHVVGQT